MASINTALFEFIPMQMEVSTAIIRDALAPLELRNLMAKVVTLTVYPFLMIAAFEALVINGAKVLLNVVIVVLNGIHGCLFTSQSDEPQRAPATGALSAAPLSLTRVSTNPVEEIEMPPPDEVARLKVEDIVTKLANESILALGWTHRKKLESYREELKHLHPFQFLESIFGPFSEVKDLMPVLMNRTHFVTSGFLGGFADSMKRPIHQKMLEPYLPSFARKMGMRSEKVRAFLIPNQNWEGLVTHLMKIHSKS